MSVLLKVPSSISETWEWKTDILMTKNDTEQRFSIRENPRVSLSLDYDLLTMKDRVAEMKIASGLVSSWAEVVFWQYATPASASSGSYNISFDLEVCPFIAGDGIAIMNRDFSLKAVSTVVSVHPGYVTTDYLFSSGLTEGYVCPVYQCYVDGVDFQKEYNHAEMKLSVVVPSKFVVSNGSSYVLQTHDGIPVLDRFKSDDIETVKKDKEIIDFGTGPVDLFSSRPMFKVSQKVTFVIKRWQNNDLKFWRKFLSTCKGSWKAFLISSDFPDFTPVSITKNTGYFICAPTDFLEVAVTFPSYKYIRIKYADGSTSTHTITSYATSGPNRRVNITPNLPDDDKVGGILRISRLLKVVMDDTVSLNHGHLDSEISFDVLTTDYG